MLLHQYVQFLKKFQSLCLKSNVKLYVVLGQGHCEEDNGLDIVLSMSSQSPKLRNRKWVHLFWCMWIYQNEDFGKSNKF